MSEKTAARENQSTKTESGLWRLLFCIQMAIGILMVLMLLLNYLDYRNTREELVEIAETYRQQRVDSLVQGCESVSVPKGQLQTCVELMLGYPDSGFDPAPYLQDASRD